MPLALPHARRIGARALAVAGVALVAACGPAPQGGFQGFPPAAVTTLVLQPRTLPVSYEYVGQTAGSKEVEVRARVTGILEQRLFAEGGWVKAGQPLFVIDPKPLEAQAAAADAEVARARAQLTQAEREVARLKPLAERRAIGQKEADDAVSNAELARAALKAAEARLAEVEPQPRLHARQRADHGPLEPRQQVGRQPRHRQRHAAHDDLAGRPDLGARSTFRRTTGSRSTARSPRAGSCCRRTMPTT